MTQGIEAPSFTWHSPIVLLYEVSSWACRIITSRWQEVAMVAGVACAIIGAVVAFFHGMPLLACSFLFFGAVNTAGLFYMYQINAIRELEKEILGGMRNENDRLKENNLSLEKTKSELESAVFALRTENALQSAEFKKNNKNLSEQIEELTAVVVSLKSFSALIIEEISQCKENTELAQSILSKIQPHVDRADFVLEKISEQFKSQDQAFSQRIEELKKFFSDETVQEHIQSLKETTQELNETTQELKAEMGRLIDIQKDYITIQKEFTTERLLLEQVRKEQAHLHQLLKGDEQAISGAVKELTVQNQELREGLDALRRILNVLEHS